jgi:hypothetical protein
MSMQKSKLQIVRSRAAMVALVMIAGATPLAAVAAVNVDITVAPPAPRVEVVPAPRPGYVWAPGYWDYRGHSHAWVAGRWLPERRGYRYEPARWVPHEGHYRLEQGHWVR